MKTRSPLVRATALAAILSVVAAVAVVLIPASPAPAADRPEPSPFPLPDAWYLDFKHGAPKRIVVDVPGQKAPTAYWYLTYTVTNNTGKDQEFLPEFEMVTQDGKVHRSDHPILLPVFDAIKKAENNPLLLPLTQMIGTLRQGEDQAKDGVAIWEEPMPRMGAFSIYVGGLNSEFVNPTDDKGEPIRGQPTQGNPQGEPITLRKTLELNYVIWGDEIKPGMDEVQKKPERWLMR